MNTIIYPNILHDWFHFPTLHPHTPFRTTLTIGKRVESNCQVMADSRLQQAMTVLTPLGSLSIAFILFKTERFLDLGSSRLEKLRAARDPG